MFRNVRFGFIHTLISIWICLKHMLFLYAHSAQIFMYIYKQIGILTIVYVNRTTQSIKILLANVCAQICTVCAVVCVCLCLTSLRRLFVLKQFSAKPREREPTNTQTCEQCNSTNKTCSKCNALGGSQKETTVYYASNDMTFSQRGRKKPVGSSM